MLFKELELFGFKSFAEKTKIKFEPGVTAIVGPNGCGKSNISDAIRWVLGEQSAKTLRGSSMGDVIFNGTEFKEPLGVAEVSLTLDNGSKFLPIEYDEVTISRRLYRSGESEYLINKNPVRLKDINDLLAGSGLGVEAYSMIEQGKIGMILSSNPDERRYIFEEASGIVRYKAKKREALRKLESTENNLVRVNDIIIEVKRQIASMDRQVRKAERYKEYFERLKELDTKQAWNQYTQLKEETLNYEENKNESEGKEKLLNSKISEVSGMVDEFKSELVQQDSKIFELQSRSMDVDFSIKSGQDTIRMNKERIEELTQLESDLKEEKAALKERIEKLSSKIKELNSQILVVSQERNQKSDLLGQKKTALGELQKKIEESQSNIKNSKTKTVDILADQSKTKNEITRITGEIHNSQARLRRLRIEREKVANELIAIEKNLKEASLVVDEVSSKINVFNQEKEKLDHELESDRLDFSQIDSKIRDFQNEFHSLQSKLKFLEDLVRKNEGFTGGTKALLQHMADGRLLLEGLERPLAELIDVKRGYEVPIEVALGPFIEAIVIRDWGVATKAISYLKDRKLGKASFINKTVEKHISRENLIPNHPAYLGKLIDFVKVKPDYESMIYNLLKDIVVVKDIDSALEIYKSNTLPYYVKLITPKGQMVHNGLIVGGSTVEDAGSSLIGRQARIAQTKLDIENIMAETVILKKRQSDKRESIAHLEQKLAEIREELRREEIDLARKNSKKVTLEKEFKKMNDESGLVALEIDETSDNINNLNSRADSLKEKIKEIEGDYSYIQNVITDSQTFLSKAGKKKEELLVNIAQLETELSASTNKEETLRSDIESQKTYLEEQSRLLQSKETGLVGAAEKAKELLKEIEVLSEDGKKLDIEKTSIEESSKVLKESRGKLQTSMQNSEENLKNYQKSLNTTKDRVHNLQMEKTQLSFKMENLKNRIAGDYDIDLEIYSAGDGYGDMNWDEVANEIAQCKEKISKLGGVSLGSIQEDKELKERLSFLLRQQEDLANAKESLLKAIKKINHTTRQMFMDTFTKVQVEFKNFFRYLFGGGKADILLVDQRDVLESDIEIVVRPPGKKLQSISLLSGGEKALAAMSLLFAIFKVNPSPFCLLDEVDAPLDDSNIGRFSKVVSDFTSQTQFIVITHNKKTISLADVMYGITMNKAGVSKIVSVKFAKGKEEAAALV